MSTQTDLEPHDHLFHELVVITGGAGLHRTERGEFDLEAGDVFLVPPGVVHSYLSTRKLSLVNLLFLPERLQPLRWEASELPAWHLLFTADPAFRGHDGSFDHLRLPAPHLVTALTRIRALEKEIAEAKPGWKLASTALFCELVVHLCRSAELPSGSAGGPAARLARILSRMETDFREPIDLAALRAEAGVSERTLLRWFRLATGKPPLRHLLDVRLENARRLLVETDLPVARVAWESGFDDANYFARAYRGRFGESPKASR